MVTSPLLKNEKYGFFTHKVHSFHTSILFSPRLPLVVWIIITMLADYPYYVSLHCSKQEKSMEYVTDLYTYSIPFDVLDNMLPLLHFSKTLHQFYHIIIHVLIRLLMHPFRYAEVWFGYGAGHGRDSVAVAAE